MSEFKSYKWDPIKEFGLDIARADRADALEEVATYLREAMLDYIGEGKSPVSGGRWVRSLTKEYKKKKEEESGADYANLELSGDLLDSLSVDANSRSITIDVGGDQYGKAEGHITGIYGDKSKKIRPRQFCPQGEESFKREIVENVKEILAEYERDSGESES